jgi:hypothetical protein
MSSNSGRDYSEDQAQLVRSLGTTALNSRAKSAFSVRAGGGDRESRSRAGDSR